MKLGRLLGALTGIAKPILANISAAQRAPDQTVQTRMNSIACGDDFAPLNRALAAPEITDETARFAHQQNARRAIPDAETALPKSVKAASGTPGAVQPGRTTAAAAPNPGPNGDNDPFTLPKNPH